MRQVAENVFQATGAHVNWVLCAGEELTLIDGGWWYGDHAAVERSIRIIGWHASPGPVPSARRRPLRPGPHWAGRAS